MRIFYIILICFYPISSSCQITYCLDNTLTGIYGTTKSGDQLALVTNGTNHFGLNNFVFDVNPFYSIKYNNNILIDNDLLIREDFGYKFNNVSLFVIHQYSYSFIRGIISDNWFGSGVGKRFDINKNLYIGLSYAMLYEYRHYYEQDLETILRNSFRFKIGFKKKSTHIILEYYFQPNINNSNDINIFGSTQVVLLANKPINIIIQNIYNFQNTDKIKTIQSTTIGIKFKLISKTDKVIPIKNG